MITSDVARSTVYNVNNASAASNGDVSARPKSRRPRSQGTPGNIKRAREAARSKKLTSIKRGMAPDTMSRIIQEAGLRSRGADCEGQRTTPNCERCQELLDSHLHNPNQVVVWSDQSCWMGMLTGTSATQCSWSRRMHRIPVLRTALLKNQRSLPVGWSLVPWPLMARPRRPSSCRLASPSTAQHIGKWSWRRLWTRCHWGLPSSNRTAPRRVRLVQVKNVCVKSLMRKASWPSSSSSVALIKLRWPKPTRPPFSPNLTPLDFAVWWRLCAPSHTRASQH